MKFANPRVVEDAGYGESTSAIDAETSSYEILGPGADVCPGFCVVGEGGEVAGSNLFATRRPHKSIL